MRFTSLSEAFGHANTHFTVLRSRKREGVFKGGGLVRWVCRVYTVGSMRGGLAVGGEICDVSPLGCCAVVPSAGVSECI